MISFPIPTTPQELEFLFRNMINDKVLMGHCHSPTGSKDHAFIAVGKMKEPVVVLNKLSSEVSHHHCSKKDYFSCVTICMPILPFGSPVIFTITGKYPFNIYMKIYLALFHMINFFPQELESISCTPKLSGVSSNVKTDRHVDSSKNR